VISNRGCVPLGSLLKKPRDGNDSPMMMIAFIITFQGLYKPPLRPLGGGTDANFISCFIQ